MTVTIVTENSITRSQPRVMMTPMEGRRNMRTLLTAIATVILLMAGSLVWKAEAATMSGVGSLAPLTKSYAPVVNVYYYRRGYYGYRRPYYGYRRHYYGYGYRPYGYYGYRRPYYRYRY
jgi:hypothetical protein